MAEPTSPKAQSVEQLVAELDARLTAMARDADRFPIAIQDTARNAVEVARSDLAQVTTNEQLTTLANRYRSTSNNDDPVTRGLHTQLVARFDAHLAQRPTEPARAGEVVRAQSTLPKEQVVSPGINAGDLVVFRVGDQSRWGIVDHRPRDAAFVLRVSGVPHVVPATNITHIIDPRQQPDLPLDSILDGERLRVRRVHWGEEAQRLADLAKGRPPMQRLAHVTDGLDLRDGIGTNNERPDAATRGRGSAHDRSDQRPDVEFIRSNPGGSRRAETPTGATVTRLPTAGPNAMGWSSRLDDVPQDQTRVIVAGSRTLGAQHLELIRETLRRELGDVDPAKVTIVHGAAQGADRLAAQAARELGMRVEPHRADWDTHGKAAGPIRNQQMLDAGATRVFAFVDQPLAEARGTADVVGRARRAGIPTTVVPTPELAQTAVASPPVRALR